MLRNSWLKSLEYRMQYRRLLGRSMKRRSRTAAQNRPVPVQVSETLEDRTLLTTFVVDTTLDESDGNFGAGDLSLREAIEQADVSPGADIIRFAPGLGGAVFNITQGPLPVIDESLQIVGTIGNAQTINGAGLVVNAAGPGNTTSFSANSVNINNAPGGAGLLINAINDGVANVTLLNSRITNSATNGIKFVSHTGGIVNLNLGVVAVASNGDATQSAGILGEVGVDGAGAESNNTPGNFATANLNFDTVRVLNEFLEGFKLNVADGGQVTTPNGIRNSAFNDNSVGNQRSAVKFEVTDAGSSLQADFVNSAANRSKGTGFELSAVNGADLDIGFTNSQAMDAVADGVSVLADDASATVDVDGLTANNAGDTAFRVELLNGSTGTFNTFNNVTLNGAAGSGLAVSAVQGSQLTAFNSTGLTTNSNNAVGVLITTLDPTSDSNYNFTNTIANGNRIRGVQVGINTSSTNNIVFTNLTSAGNILGEALGIGVQNNAVSMITVNGGTLTSAGSPSGGNNVFHPVQTGGTSTLNINGVNLNNSRSSGIVVDANTGSTATLNVSNSTSTGNRLVGIAAFARNNGTVTGNFDTVNVTGAGQAAPANGFRLEALGAGATGNFSFNNVIANNAAGTGISLLYNGGATGTVSQFNNVSAQNAGLDGLNINVRGVNSVLNNFVATGVNVSGAGASAMQPGDGLDITVAGPGAMGTFDFTDLTAEDADGIGIKVQAENTATLNLAADDFSADDNAREGIALDVGTVVGGSQLTGTFSNGSASGNGVGFMQVRDGVRATVQRGSTDVDLEFDAVLANGNTGDGFGLLGNMGASFTTDLSNGTSALGNLRNGVDFDADGAATTVSLTADVPGNAFDGNAQDGVNILLSNSVTADDITVQGSASINQGSGIVVRDDGSGVTINNLQVTGNALINGNQGNGLIVDLDGTLGITSLDLTALTVNNNVGDQINVSLANMTLTDVVLNDIMAVGPGSGMGNGDGVELTLDNTAITNSLSLNGIVATDNGEDGLQINFLNGATIPVASGIDIGTFDNNGQHGININATTSTVSIDLTNSQAGMGPISSASRNGVHGLNVELNDATLTMDTVDSQSFTNNGGSGINIQAAVPSTFTSGNSFTNNVISDNGGFGFRGIFNGGQFDIAIGEPGAGNTIDNNNGAGISIDMVQNSVGQLSIQNNEITNTNAGAPGFAGEGIFIRQLGTANPAQATNSLQNISGPMGTPGVLIQNNFIGVDDTSAANANASFGITFQSEESSNISGLHIFDNEVSENGDDGLSFRRFDQVSVSGFRIEANTFDNNAGDGIELTGENDDNSTMEVIIGPAAPTAAELATDSATTLLPVAPPRGNMITNNGGDGIRLQVNADAGLNVDVRGNTIVANQDDGIGLSEVVLDPSDNRQISGVWVQNTISDNVDNGVESNAVTFGTVLGGDGSVVMDIRDGVTPAQGLFVRQNTIGAVLNLFGQVVPGMDGNGGTGIEINGAGSSTWTDTDIIRNGRAVTGNRATGHGIDLQSVGKETIIDNNLIRQNFQDGIEIQPSQISFIQADLTRNRVQQNMGRGLDILTVDRADTRINVTNGNVFNSNLEEGIYQVITADPNQSQSVFAGNALVQGGNGLTTFATGTLIIDDAIVSNNGDPSVVGNLVASAGIVIRVGTQDSPSVFTTSHFATNGDPVNPVFFWGGMFAQITNSTLLGNFGDDVFIHSFRSTGDPATIAGTWSDTEFTVNNGQNGDPLARLDLVWGTDAAGNGNTFNSVDLNNTLRRGTPDGQAGAFYDNAEGTFKSRTSNLTPGGPFSQASADRRRNAQRAPARDYPGGFMLGPANGTAFQYPGLGDSTFRVFAGGDTTVALDLAIDGFFLDDNPLGGDFSPIESPGEANGTGFTGSQGSFELPFGWGTF